MPTFLPVGSTSYIDNHGYDPFARARRMPRAPPPSRKTRRKPRPAPTAKPRESAPEEVETKSKDDFDLDYLGISNMMRSITFKGTRKWRLKNPDNDIDKKVVEKKRARPLRAWADDSSKVSDNTETREKEPEVDPASLRRSRSSSFIKYKYPKEFHQGSGWRRAAAEEQVPQCLRHYPRYTNLPMKQSCGYDPYRSVTQLKVHTVQSGSLPHPALPNSKPKRPMSAPPSYGSAKTMPQRGPVHKKKEPLSQQNGATVPAREHNGVYHMVHSPMSQIEFTTIREEGGALDPQSLPVVLDPDSAGPVLMKGDYSDEEDEEGGFETPYEDTLVSLEDVDDDADDAGDGRRTSIEQRYPSVQNLSDLENHDQNTQRTIADVLGTDEDDDDDDYDLKYTVNSDSGGESLLDESEVKQMLKRVKEESKKESDAEEVESDY